MPVVLWGTLWVIWCQVLTPCEYTHLPIFRVLVKETMEYSSGILPYQFDDKMVDEPTEELNESE